MYDLCSEKLLVLSVLSDPSRQSGEKAYIVEPTNAYMRHPTDKSILIPGTLYMSKGNLTFRTEATAGRAALNAKCPRSQMKQVTAPQPTEVPTDAPMFTGIG